MENEPENKVYQIIHKMRGLTVKIIRGFQVKQQISDKLIQINLKMQAKEAAWMDITYCDSGNHFSVLQFLQYDIQGFCY